MTDVPSHMILIGHRARQDRMQPRAFRFTRPEVSTASPTVHTRSGMLCCAGPRRCMVERLTINFCIRGAICGQKFIPTMPNTVLRCMHNKVDRLFVADWPNKLWIVHCGGIGASPLGNDFTYLAKWSSIACVAFVIDVFARLIVGWHALRFHRLCLRTVPSFLSSAIPAGWSLPATSLTFWSYAGIRKMVHTRPK